jgi:hypothetical protein
MPGGVEYGELQDLAWSDAYGSEWALDDILRGNPAVLTVAGSHTLDNPVAGMVVTFDCGFDEGVRLVATLAPGNVSDSGELLYLTWTDRFGGHHQFDAIVTGNPTVVSEALSEDGATLTFRSALERLLLPASTNADSGRSVRTPMRNAELLSSRQRCDGLNRRRTGGSGRR